MYDCRLLDQENEARRNTKAPATGNIRFESDPGESSSKDEEEEDEGQQDRGEAVHLAEAH